jgi:hypothetical protein
MVAGIIRPFPFPEHNLLKNGYPLRPKILPRRDIAQRKLFEA